MAKVITILLNKGGTGKTTTTLVLSQIISWLGCKVLVIDHDPQGNSSLYFGFRNKDTQDIIDGVKQPEESDYNISELYRFRYNTVEDVKSLIRKTNVPNIDIIPSSNRLDVIDSILKNNTGNTTVFLKRALKSISDDYDYILIDNAPASNRLTVNSIIASDYLLMPVEVDNFSLKGLKETLSSLSYLRGEYEIKAAFLGAFLTKTDMRTNASKIGLQMYKESLGNKLLKTTIRHDTAIKDAMQKLMPLLDNKKTSTCGGLIDYCKLLIEMDILDDDNKKRLSSIIE